VQVGVQFYAWNFLIWEEDWKLLLCVCYEDVWIVCWWYSRVTTCALHEDYSCLVDIIYVWFYPPAVHISKLMSSGDYLNFLPHSFPAPVTSYAVPMIILTFWTVSFLCDALLLRFNSLLQTIILSNVIKSYVSVTVGYDIMPLSVWFLAFWGNIVIWSLGVKSSKRWATMLSWNMGNQILSDTFHIPKELTPVPHCCRNLTLLWNMNTFYSSTSQEWFHSCLFVIVVL